MALEGLDEPQIVFSCIPWVDITVCTNERDFAKPDAADDTVPMFAWGKYVEKGGFWHDSGYSCQKPLIFRICRPKTALLFDICQPNP